MELDAQSSPVTDGSSLTKKVHQLLSDLNPSPARVSGPTSEDGAELLPAGDATLGGELAQCHFQEEHRQPPTEQEDEVRDEKCSCVEMGG